MLPHFDTTRSYSTHNMKQEVKTIEKVKVAWRCPSNIAIVKYWGKMEGQLPCNSSLSLTLENSYTEITAETFEKTSDELIEVRYYFEEERNTAFEERVVKYLTKHLAHYDFLRSHALEIKSTNSFPHSAGIASSASAFGAIALALTDIKYQLEGKELNTSFYEEASHYARLGSGSASRSIFSGYASWGKIGGAENTSDLYATEVEEIHPDFREMRDAILIVDDQPKKVSSSVGHGLMNNHPYAAQRFEQAKQRTKSLLTILKEGDMESFIEVCESEALTLHAMMMTSKDYYLLMKPKSLEVIEKIIKFREENAVPVCFTLDAGPNIHVLYPKNHQHVVEEFIKNDLRQSYMNCIFDHEGQGPRKLHF